MSYDDLRAGSLYDVNLQPSQRAQAHHCTRRYLLLSSAEARDTPGICISYITDNYLNPQEVPDTPILSGGFPRAALSKSMIFTLLRGMVRIGDKLFAPSLLGAEVSTPTPTSTSNSTSTSMGTSV